MRNLYDKTFAASLFVIATDRPITLLELVPNLTETTPGEWHGPCPFCEEGNDRFMVWPAEEPTWGGRYYCRQCGKTGNGIVFLRQFHGWPFQTAHALFARTTRQPGHQLAGEGFYAGSSGSAAPPPASSPSGSGESIENPPVFAALPPHAPDPDPQDLERAIAEESTLARAQRIRNLPDDLAARADALRADIDMAEIGYRATVRMPDLYTNTEKDYWETRLSDLYATRDSLDQDIEAERRARARKRRAES